MNAIIVENPVMESFVTHIAEKPTGMIIDWEEHKIKLDRAYKIHFLLFGEPQTHREWAERFNQVGEIIKLL